MSYSKMHYIKNNHIVGSKRYQNSWGFCPMIWDALCDKYGVEGEWNTKWENLWDAERGPLQLKAWEKTVLYLTYDHAVLTRKDFSDIALALHIFYQAHRKEEHACHLEDIANDVFAAQEDTDYLVFQGTSCADEMWTEYDFVGDDRHWILEVYPLKGYRLDANGKRVWG